MQCVILAGGLGTRIRELTGDLPKSLIPIHGKPFIDYQLRALRRAGISEVVLCIGYQGAKIQAVVGDGAAWDLSVRYVDEGPELRGTGGALRLAGERDTLETLFFLMYGDSYLPIDFQPIWAYFNSRIEPALMTVLHNQGRWDKSNVRLEGSRITLYDKKNNDPAMDYIDYGLSLIRRDPMMAAIPAGTAYDLADYFSLLSRANKLAGYEVEHRFYEIGSAAGIEDFKTFMKGDNP